MQPTAGEVTIDGEPVTGPDPRRIFVFQERGVFPWLTVEENIGFGLFRLRDAEKRERIAHYVAAGRAAAASRSPIRASSPAA